MVMKLHALFQNIDGHQIDSSDEFNAWFDAEWAVRNSLQALNAPLDKIKKGALLEWEYCRRGAKPDTRKYCDVILGEEFGELSNKIIDTKYVHVRRSKSSIFDTVLQRQRSRAGWYAQLKIDEIHVWCEIGNSQVIQPWFRWVVKSDEVHQM